MKLVPNTKNWTVDAYNSIVVRDGGCYRISDLMGGYSSRSGLTRRPAWIEAGAIKAVREDCLVRYIAEPSIGSAIEDTVVVFHDHGTKPKWMSLVHTRDVMPRLKAWREFRLNGKSLPDGEGLVNRAVRLYTRPLYTEAHLTFGEGLDGLPRRFPDAQLILNEVGNIVPGDVIKVDEVGQAILQPNYVWLWKPHYADDYYDDEVDTSSSEEVVK